MKDKKKILHIISHDVPYPADYGGVIDIFSTLKTLHKKGIEIILHCFEYGRGEQPALLDYCSRVYYYKRKEGHKAVCFHYPYIVASRSNAELLDRLAEDNYPILIEGIHSSFLLNDARFANRKMVLRTFNVESVYYHHLFKHERTFYKKIFFWQERRLLRNYEAQVATKVPVLTLSESDQFYFRDKLKARHVKYVPALLPFQYLNCPTGQGSFCLYHGNLEIAENEKAVAWLLKQVFQQLKIPFVIAGHAPSSRLLRLAHLQSHTCLVADPGDKELNDLIQKAQVNILPSFNETGVKLKLLNALFNGRHCVVNKEAVMGSALGSLCHIGDSAREVQQIVRQLYHQPFMEEDIRKRRKILHAQYDNSRNADLIMSYLY